MIERIQAMASKIERLSEMGLYEVGYRAGKALAFRLDKWRVNAVDSRLNDKDLVQAFGLAWYDDEPALSGHRLRCYLRETVGRRFYFNPARVSEYVRLGTRYHGDWINAVCARAERICQHRFRLLGCDEFQLGDEIDFLRSPETGHRWPRHHWIDIDLRASTGDPKIIWELNRHQHLLWLGLAYCYTRDGRYADEFVSQIEAWIDQNPAQIGINWASSLEIAFRALNWCWALMLFINSPRLSDESVLRIVGSLVAHMDAILRNPSVYTSPNTHLIGEAFALYLGGLLFAEHRRAPRWRSFGTKYLAGEMHRQILSDGAYFEQSSYYHCYMVEFYLLAAIIARRNGQKGIIDEVRLARACEYLMHITEPGCRLTAFGDEDGGKALMLAATSYRHPGDLLSTAAALYGRGDFKYCAGEFSPATLWLLGPYAHKYYATIDAQSPRQTSISLAASGHIALRADWSAESNYLLFHCPAGTPMAGHTHADCLSFELSSGGRGRLVDSGTFRYNGDAAMRDYFRGTSAHNTVRIDKKEQSTPGDTFKWRRKACARLLAHVLSPVADYVQGEHDGYLALPGRCLHRRAILFAKPDYFLVWDEFAGSSEHYFESFFHCGEADIDRLADGTLSVRYQDGYRLLVLPVSNNIIAVDALPVSDSKPAGWYSRAYGEKRPACSLRMHWQGSTPSAVLTVLFPYREEPPEIETASLSAPDAFGVRISTTQYEDILVFSPRKASFPQVFDKVNFTGEKLFLRAGHDAASAVLGLNATTIEFNNQRILKSDRMSAQFIWNGGAYTMR